MMSSGDIQVTVKLYGLLRDHRPKTAAGAPHHPFTLTLPTKATVTDLADRLGIPDGFVNAAAVNNTAVSPDTSLNDGDQVNLFPPSAGG
jgi:molybdopterin converting factor small subunit